MSTLRIPRRGIPGGAVVELPDGLRDAAVPLPLLGPEPVAAGARSNAGAAGAGLGDPSPARRVGTCSLGAALIALDLLAIGLAATLATWATDGAAGQGLRLGAAFALAWLSAITCLGAYGPRREEPARGASQWRISSLAALVSLTLCVAVDFASDAGVQSTAVMLLAGLAVTLGRAGSGIIGRRLGREGWHLQRAAVIGTGTRQADDLAQWVEAAWAPATRVVAKVDLTTLGDGSSMDGLAQSIEDLVRRRYIDQLLIAEDGLDPQLRQYICRHLAPLGIACTVIPASAGAVPKPRAVRLLGDRIAVDVVTQPLSEGSRLLKRMEDVVLATLLLLMLSPLLLVIAAAIRMESKGPIFFRQRRFGFRGEVFEALKFRSMYHDAAPSTGFRQTSRHDPRVTRVGRFIRRTSLDELPQLLNVLDGTMSIVGPRPHAVEMTVEGSTLDRLLADYTERYRMKPGITGWAQVSGLRGEVHSRDKLAARVEYDLFYIANWSVLFDLKIILLSVLVVFRSRHAY